jgi:hypothetical protein
MFCICVCLSIKLNAVARPGAGSIASSSYMSTLVPLADRVLHDSNAPLNKSQRAAVLGLRGGLAIIQGTASGSLNSYTTVYCR